MKKRKIKASTLLILDIFLIVISVLVYKYIFEVETTKKIYAEQTSKFIENNENPVFKIGKIILYSSANAVDNSNGELKNIDITQFTDMEIYIDNKIKNAEITAENTINEMYISNIKIQSKNEIGEKIFNYKNPLYCGKYVELDNWQEDGILFNIVNTNEKNNESDYDNSIFYTDCSNPISLGYINKNILTGCEVSGDSGTITFDGTILKDAGVNLEELGVTISFSINITNNYNEKFVCDVAIDNNLTSEDEGIYSGYLMKILNPEGDNYNFIKISD